MELSVYNLLGQKVVTLLNGAREAGAYTVEWDSRDANGHELASGIYLCRMRMGEQEVGIRKMLLLR